MAKGEDTVKKAKPRLGSKESPEDMCMVRTTSAKREERRKERLDAGGKSESHEGWYRFMFRMEVVNKLNSVEMEPKETRENQCSLMTTLQLTKNVLGRVRGALREKNVLVESLQKAARARNRGARVQGGLGRGEGAPTVRDLCTGMLLCRSTGCTRSSVGVGESGDI